MSSFLNGLRNYAEKWAVKSQSKLDNNEASGIASAEVVEGEFGASLMFTMKNGVRKYGKLSRDTSLQVGDKVRVESITATVLSKSGEADIIRFDGTAV